MTFLQSPDQKIKKESDKINFVKLRKFAHVSSLCRHIQVKNLSFAFSLRNVATSITLENFEIMVKHEQIFEVVQK